MQKVYIRPIQKEYIRHTKNLHPTQLENFFRSEFRFLTWGIPTEEWNRSAFSFRSVPIVHEAEIDSVNRAVEPIGLPIGLQIGLQIGRPTPVEKKDKFYMAVLKLQWTDDLKSAFIHKRCIKRNFVPDSGRSVGPNQTARGPSAVARTGYGNGRCDQDRPSIQTIFIFQQN